MTDEVLGAFAKLLPGVSVEVKPEGFTAELGGGYTLLVRMDGDHWVFALHSKEGDFVEHHPICDAALCDFTFGAHLERFLGFIHDFSGTALDPSRKVWRKALDLGEEFREFYFQVCESLGVKPNWDADGFQSAHVFRKIAQLRSGSISAPTEGNFILAYGEDEGEDVVLTHGTDAEGSQYVELVYDTDYWNVELHNKDGNTKFTWEPRSSAPQGEE